MMRSVNGRTFTIRMTAVLWLLSFAAPGFAADVSVCASCHGQRGISEDPLTPNLAGQKSGYLRSELIAYRDGRRSDAQMTAAAQDLTDEQIDFYVDHFSAAPRPRAASHAATLNPRTPPLVFCVRCHGTDGISPNHIWPNLAGQHVAYMERQIAAYAGNERNDPMMAMWGGRAAADEMREILEYFSAQGAHF